MTNKEKAADSRLRRKYGIGLEDYNRMLVEGNPELPLSAGGCWVCGIKPKPDRRLHVNHDHRVRYYRVKTESIGTKGNGGYTARIKELNLYSWGETKRDAIDGVKQLAKKKSVRGLLCWRHNAALQKFRDDPELMESAAKYIRSYTERIKIG